MICFHEDFTVLDSEKIGSEAFYDKFGYEVVRVFYIRFAICNYCGEKFSFEDEELIYD